MFEKFDLACPVPDGRGSRWGGADIQPALVESSSHPALVQCSIQPALVKSSSQYGPSEDGRRQKQHQNALRLALVTVCLTSIYLSSLSFGSKCIYFDYFLNNRYLNEYIIDSD
jgi:hypothetical protein